MAKPNYSFEKRQREIAKKKKKEEKLKDKVERKQHGDAPGDSQEAGELPVVAHEGGTPSA